MFHFGRFFSFHTQRTTGSDRQSGSPQSHRLSTGYLGQTLMNQRPEWRGEIGGRGERFLGVSGIQVPEQLAVAAQQTLKTRTFPIRGAPTLSLSTYRAGARSTQDGQEQPPTRAITTTTTTTFTSSSSSLLILLRDTRRLFVDLQMTRSNNTIGPLTLCRRTILSRYTTYTRHPRPYSLVLQLTDISSRRTSNAWGSSSLAHPRDAHGLGHPRHPTTQISPQSGLAPRSLSRCYQRSPAPLVPTEASHQRSLHSSTSRNRVCHPKSPSGYQTIPLENLPC